MNYKIHGILSLLLLTCILFSSCDKGSSIYCSGETGFCHSVSLEYFDGIEPTVNDYLRTLPKNDAGNLEKLRNWLDCKTCVKRVDITCNSCIKTNPATSEIRVVFNSGGKEKAFTLDIRMGEQLKYISYHE